MTKQTHIRVGGEWKLVNNVWTRVSGAWVGEVMPKVRVGGVFKECMEYNSYEPIDGNEFTWNGLTYKVIVKNYGGGVVLAWLDRNMGASRVPTAYNDSLGYGDLCQWGRPVDGHQLKTSNTTTTLSSSDTPGHSNFIILTSSPYDWRSPQNHTLWQSAETNNNSCPPGWRIPTESEYLTERNSWSSSNYNGAYGSSLKWPAGGWRVGSSGNIYNEGGSGYIWTSKISTFYSVHHYFTSSGVYSANSRRSNGCSVRACRNV